MIRSETNSMGWPVALRALRVRDWWYFTPLPFASVVDRRLDWHDAVPAAAASTLAAAACLAFAYGINSVADRRLDRDLAKNAFVGAVEVPRAMRGVLAGSVLVALGVSATLSAWSAACAIVSLVAGAVYSAGPRWKRVPFLGTATNLLIFAPLALMSARPPIERRVAVIVATFAVLLTQSQLLHELADREEDLDDGVRTTASVLGSGRFPGLAAALGPAASCVLLIAFRPIDETSAAAAAAVLIAALALHRVTDVDAATRRRRHRWLSLFFGAMLFLVAVVSSSP